MWKRGLQRIHFIYSGLKVEVFCSELSVPAPFLRWWNINIDSTCEEVGNWLRFKAGGMPLYRHSLIKRNLTAQRQHRCLCGLWSSVFFTAQSNTNLSRSSDASFWKIDYIWQSSHWALPWLDFWSFILTFLLLHLHIEGKILITQADVWNTAPRISRIKVSMSVMLSCDEIRGDQHAFLLRSLGILIYWESSAQKGHHHSSTQSFDHFHGANRSLSVVLFPRVPLMWCQGRKGCWKLGSHNQSRVSQSIICRYCNKAVTNSASLFF